MELAHLLGRLSARGSLKRFRILLGEDNEDVEREKDPVGEFLSRKRRGIADPEEENVLELEEYGEELKTSGDKVNSSETEGQPEMVQEPVPAVGEENRESPEMLLETEAEDMPDGSPDENILETDAPETGLPDVEDELEIAAENENKPVDLQNISGDDFTTETEMATLEPPEAVVDSESPGQAESGQLEQNDESAEAGTQSEEQATVKVAEAEVQPEANEGEKKDNSDDMDDLLNVFKSEKDADGKLNALYEGLSEVSADSLLEETRIIAEKCRRTP